MINTLTLVCDEVIEIKTRRQTHGMVQVTLSNVDNDFLPDIDADDIVLYQDVDRILEAIGVEEVAEWLKEKGTL